MWKNYLKVALRQLRRQKLYAFISIAGLALGLACCVLLFLFLKSEWTHDHFHADLDDTYRVLTVVKHAGGDRTQLALTPVPLVEALRRSRPDVEQTVRLKKLNDAVVVHEENSYEPRVLFADSTVFDVFSFPLARGRPRSVLSEPGNVVLTKETAQKYFGSENPLGQRLSVQFDETTRDFVVAGVAENVPENSSIQFDVLLPFSAVKYTLPQIARQQLLSSGTPYTETFVRLSRGSDESPELSDALARLVSIGSATAKPSLRLQPLSAVHFDSDVSSQITTSSDPLYSYILAGIALLVLAVAGLNYATLSLGRSARRVKEVGVRKAAGAFASQVRRQFLAESLLTSALAGGLGVILASLTLPGFSRLVDKDLTFYAFADPLLPFLLLATVLAVGLLAGSYPAAVLARYRPGVALQGRAQGRGGQRLLHVLVATQFFLSTLVVTTALVMTAQLDYLKDKDLGFEAERLVVVGDRPEEGSSVSVRVWRPGDNLYERFRREVSRHPEIKSIAGSSSSFGRTGVPVDLKPRGAAQVEAYVMPVTPPYVETMGIEVVKGRDFSPDRPADRKGAVLVNEALVDALGWRSPLGKELPVEKVPSIAPSVATARVIGVVENYHVQSLRTEIKPSILTLENPTGGASNVFMVRYRPGSGPQDVLDVLKQSWQRVAPPNKPFEYTFTEQVVESQYREEERWQAIVYYSSWFALLTACSGLFGLAALATVRRTKEIGIRKALGASTTSIMVLLSKDFLKVVLVAFVLAVPVSYFAVREWLSGFAYHISPGPKLFLGAGALMLLSALVAVGYQTFRAAAANPVDSLRHE